MTLKEWIALSILLICLVLWGRVPEASETSYTWVYGGYSYTPKKHNDPLYQIYGEEHVTIQIGKSYCSSLDQSSVCVKAYYQHKSRPDTSKDIGHNFGLLDFEYRWY